MLRLGASGARRLALPQGLPVVIGGADGPLANLGLGAIRPGSVQALAHVLFGGMVEAAMLLAASPTPRKARAEVGGAVLALIDGLAEPRPARKQTRR